MPGQHIFITGSTGFIGRHVVARLLSDGHRLRLAVRNPERCPPQWRSDDRIDIFRYAAPEQPASFTELAGAAAVVHLAGLAGLPVGFRGDAELLFAKVNAEATGRLTEAAARAGVPSFIHMSSVMAIAGNASPTNVDDKTPAAPVSAYGRSKLKAEKYVSDLAQEGAFAVSLRPPLVVGAEAKGNWAALQRLAATGLPLPFAGLHNRRSFVSAQTLAEAVSVLCSRNWPADRSGGYCIADPEPLSLREVVTELRRGMGMGPRLLPVPPAFMNLLGAAPGLGPRIASLTGELVVDSSHFFETFGFRPATGLREAIRQSGATYFQPRRGTAQNG